MDPFLSRVPYSAPFIPRISHRGRSWPRSASVRHEVPVVGVRDVDVFIADPLGHVGNWGRHGPEAQTLASIFRLSVAVA